MSMYIHTVDLCHNVGLNFFNIYTLLISCPVNNIMEPKYITMKHCNSYVRFSDLISRNGRFVKAEGVNVRVHS